MGWARVAVVNEDWSPLKMIDVECFDIDTGIPITVVATDLGGIALFNGLPNDQRYFFKPRVRRVSTKVGNRTYTGQVRIQILASSGGTCYDCFVDADGGMGSHTTIQSAIDAYAATDGRPWMIAVKPKEGASYVESLEIPSTEFHAIHGCAGVAGFPQYEHQGTSVGSVKNAVRITSDDATKATIDSTGAGTAQLELKGLLIRPHASATVGYTVTPSYVYLKFQDVEIHSAATGALSIGTVAGGLLERCVIGDDETKIAFLLGLAGGVAISDCAFEGQMDTSTPNGFRMADSVIIANVADYIIKLGYQGAASSWRVVNCYIRQKSASGNGVRLIGAVGAESFGLLVNTNFIYGAGAGTGVSVNANVDAATIVGNVIYNWDTGVDAGGADNITVMGNSYPACTTKTTGGGGTGTILETTHDLLDGTIHTDTVAQAVTAGSLVYGDDTPKWNELVISVPAANVRNVLGIDNGETVPSWKTALDGTNPADIAASASPGTSLVFAHRDHVHAHPEFASGDLHTDYALDTDLSTHAGTGAAHHALVTLGGGSAAELSLSGQALTLAAVLTPTEHTTIGDSSPHHAKYTGAEAIAAVEGEATLALDGAITEIHGDANFTLSIVSSNPRWTADSGDYLEYNRAGNYFYTNQALEVAENMALAGASLDADRVFNIAPTYTDTATKTVYGGYIELVSTPAAHSGTSHMGLRMIARSSNHAYNYTHATGFVGFQALAQHWGSGALTSLYGTWMFIDINGSGDVADAFGFKILARTLPGSSGKFTNLYYLHLRAPEKLGTGAADNVYGLYFEDFSFGTSSNYAIYLAGTSGLARQGIWWNGDTNLYRSAANVLKTDDSFVAAGTVSVGTDAVLTRLGANRLTLGNVEMGTWPVAEGFLYIGSAALDHTAAGNYALLQDDNGDTFVNAAPTKSLCLRVNNGTVMKFQAGMLGFYLTAPIAKPTVSGARDEPEGALADLLTELANLGLITNSTTAS